MNDEWNPSLQQKLNQDLLLQDPIYLDKCVVSLDDEFRLVEVLDIASNESYAIKVSMK